MVEQPIRNRQVVGSTPTLGSSIFFSLASALHDAIPVCLPRLLDHDLFLECQEFARLTVWHSIKEVKYLERTVRHDGVCFSGGSTGPLSRWWSFGIRSKYGRITGEFDWLKAS